MGQQGEVCAHAYFDELPSPCMIALWLDTTYSHKWFFIDAAARVNGRFWSLPLEASE